MKMMKRILAFALMLCILGSFLVIPDTAEAANYKGKTQTFVIRKSKTSYYPESEWYASTGAKVKMTSTSTDGKKGTITFQANLAIKNKNGTVIDYFTKGSVYDYTISSMKEGGKITLTYNKSKSNGAMPPNNSYLHTFTGKIHIDKSKGCNVANIWKVDTLKYKIGLVNHSLNLYFRNN